MMQLKLETLLTFSVLYYNKKEEVIMYITLTTLKQKQILRLRKTSQLNVCAFSCYK